MTDPMHSPIPARETAESPREPGFRRRRRGPAEALGSGLVSSRKHRQARGFSLLELLTVAVILALLASLILPALVRSKALARTIVCGTHFRQWGVATLIYAADHEDRLPPEGFPNPTDRHTNSGWYIQLPRQLGLPRYHDQPWRTNPSASSSGSSIWLCPANARRSNGLNLFHYCLNQHVDGTGDDEGPVLLALIPAPSQLVWLFDSKNLPAVGSWNFPHTNLHSAGAQFLFLDGHSQRFRAPDFWDPTRQRGRTNHPSIRWLP